MRTEEQKAKRKNYMKEYNRKRYANPEFKEKRLVDMKKHWIEDEEYRKKRLDYHRKHYSENSEVRKKYNANRRNLLIEHPEELHKLIRHRQSNNDQMKLINIAAWDFMECGVTKNNSK